MSPEMSPKMSPEMSPEMAPNQTWFDRVEFEFEIWLCFSRGSMVERLKFGFLGFLGVLGLGFPKLSLLIFLIY